MNFGQSSGSVEPFEVARLAARSNSVTRPILFHYIDHRQDLERMAAAVLDAVAQSVLAVEPGKVFPLAAAAAAHAELESPPGTRSSSARALTLSRAALALHPSDFRMGQEDALAESAENH